MKQEIADKAKPLCVRSFALSMIARPSGCGSRREEREAEIDRARREFVETTGQITSTDDATASLRLLSSSNPVLGRVTLFAPGGHRTPKLRLLMLQAHPGLPSKLVHIASRGLPPVVNNGKGSLGLSGPLCKSRSQSRRTAAGVVTPRSPCSSFQISVGARVSLVPT